MNLSFTFAVVALGLVAIPCNIFLVQAQTQEWIYDPSLVTTIYGPEDTPAFATLSGVDVNAYSKWLFANGINIYASENVSNVAIALAGTVVSKLTELKPSYIDFLAGQHVYLIVARGRLNDTVNSPILEEIPEITPYNRIGLEDWQTEGLAEFPLHERGVWGAESIPFSIGEENLLCQQSDQFKGNMLLFNNFAGTLFKKYGAMYRDTDRPTWTTAQGLFDFTCTSRASIRRFTDTNACLSPDQLFAEGASIWFGGLAEPTQCDCSQWNYDDNSTWTEITACVSEGRNCVVTRDRLKAYHRELYDVLSVYFIEDDWTYTCPDGSKLDGTLPTPTMPGATSSPTTPPTSSPTATPAATLTPTASPTTPPSSSPTSVGVTGSPTAVAEATVSPTTAPSTAPTESPTAAQIPATESPTGVAVSTGSPTLPGTTLAPTMVPTLFPTSQPTKSPTDSPTAASASPTTATPTQTVNPPTVAPTINVVESPTGGVGSLSPSLCALVSTLVCIFIMWGR